MPSSTAEWDESIAVRDGEDLDHAHVELVNLCKRIDVSCSTGAAAPHARECIRTFLMYARWHFADEEAFMRKIHYPQIADHENDHARLIQDAEEFIQRFGEELLPQDGPTIAAYFRSWLQRHMVDWDKPLRDYVHQRG